MKVSDIEGTYTFDQLWIKACFVETKLRDLSSRDGTGKFSSEPSQRSENSQSSGLLNCKCYTCSKVRHLAKACPQQRRGQPMEAPGRYIAVQQRTE